MRPNILRAIRDAFVECQPLAELVGVKVFAGRAPQGTEEPYITISRVSTSREYALENENDVCQTVVQVDVWTTHAGLRDEIAEEVRLFLSGRRGYVGGDDSRLFVLGATIERDNDIEERPIDAGDEWVFRNSRDFRITHRQERVRTC